LSENGAGDHAAFARRHGDPVRGKPPGEWPVARDCGTALLVEDEELVRVSTADLLAGLGYDVREASSGQEALAMIRDGLRPDLLVTDHLMPGMSGAHLARAVQAVVPGLPVLIVSGYAEAEGIDPGLPRLTKPFRHEELAASLSALSAA
jgi:CheY-like chemotaxis protein